MQMDAVPETAAAAIDTIEWYFPGAVHSTNFAIWIPKRLIAAAY